MERTQYTSLVRQRLKEKKKFIQVLAGPRQVGKTTIITDVLSSISIPYVSETADNIIGSGSAWLEGIWQRARDLEKQYGEALLVVDEIQRLSNWSQIVKTLWDEDMVKGVNLKVLLSGSSRLFLMKGLSESLMGRFELIHVVHWSYREMKEVFGFSLENFIYFGSYPGATELIKDEKRWKNYVRDAIIEASITRDIIMLSPIQKPALLKQLMELGSLYSGQILPYDHMLGQLADAGNTTTLANYLELLRQSGLVAGLQKYSGSELRIRSSSPKLQVFNNALLSARHSVDFTSAQKDETLWGRLVESAVGCHLINSTVGEDTRLAYWRDRQDEVDFVLYNENSAVAFEVKSGSRTAGKGMGAFLKRYPKSKVFCVSAKSAPHSSVIPLEEFLLRDPLSFLN